MKQKTTQGLYKYWNAVRGRRIAPRRYEIEPSQIVPFLSETFILEQVEHADCRIRVAGTQICEWFGDHLRGAPFLGLWNEADGAVLRDGLAAVTLHGGVGLYTFGIKLGDADEVGAQFELLLLPLTHLGDQIERVLGSVSRISTPAGYDAARITGVQLTSNEVIWPDGRPFALAERFQRSASISLPPASLRKARIVQKQERRFLVYDGGRDGGGRHGAASDE